MKSKLFTSFVLLSLMWIIFIIDIILPVNFNSFGITPRTVSGLFGIAFSPFLHANFTHIISNSLPIFFLTFALLVFYQRIALRVWAMSAIIGGILVWLLARGYSTHIGASGVIFSLIGFLISSGMFRKTLKAFLVGVIVFFAYGGAIWGVLPTNPYVSWEGHLFGLIAGVFLAYIYRNEPTNYNSENYR